MGRIGLSILLVLFSLSSAGQKIPVSSQYIHDALYINPAFAGSHNSLSATLLYRSQWVGLEDSPRNNILSVHTPLFNDRVGLGFLIDHSSIGIFNETSFLANYAYRFEVHNGILALGLGFGITIQNISWQDLNSLDPNDRLLSYENSSALMPEFSLGTFYYTDRYFIGFSIPLFLSHDFDEDSGKYLPKNKFSEYNYMLMAGYKFNLGTSLIMSPSVLAKYHVGSAPQIDYNLLFTLKKKVTFGAGFRSGGEITGMFIYQVNNQLKIAYSYNFEMGDLGKYLPSSHEVTINYTFNYSRKVGSPRQTKR